MTLSDRLAAIHRNIKAACARSSRDSKSVRLVCVAKTQANSSIAEAYQLGERHFGENYAQEFLAHRESLSQDTVWHFIGHLQRNKVRHIIPHTSLIHSVDSLELAQEIDKRAAAAAKIQNVLLEVNLGEENSKAGLFEKNLFELVPQLNALNSVAVLGLMVLPPASQDPDKTRPFFTELRKIRDEINRKSLYKEPLRDLSMGMTHDFEVAIEEGATLIRIGTGLFGERVIHERKN